jgi:ribosomal protein L29
MGLKDIKDFSAEEVGMWLTVQGMGAKAETFIAEGVDGDLLLELTEEEFKNDLGLSGLQTKKIMKNIAFTKELIEDAEGGSEKEVSELEGKVKALADENEGLEEKVEALEGQISAKDAEIEELRKQIEGLNTKEEEQNEEEIPVVQGTPVPVEPAPVNHSPAPATQTRRRDAPVIGGAARGAAGGAIKGAVRKFLVSTCYF